MAPLAGQVDTLMVDTDAIYSVLSPAAAAAYTNAALVRIEAC